MSPEMRLDTVEGITVNSSGGGVANLGSRPSGGNSFTYMAPGPSSIAGPSIQPTGSFSPGGPSGLAPTGGSGSGGPGSTCGGSPAGGARPRFDEDVNLPLIKVVVLGAPGVGKTSIVKRFVNNDFTPEHRRTNGKSEFFPSLILNGSLFELKLIDLPVIPYFPANNVIEWNDFRFFGLRSAAAYVLVYDVSLPSTFNFIKTLRDQMYETRDMTNIPVIVVANKIDLVASKNYVPPPVQQPRPHQHHHHHHHHHHIASGESANHLTVAGCSNMLTLSPLISLNGALTNGSGNASHHQQQEILPIRDRKEISHLVRKTWRSSHLECSAKYNLNVMAIFRELAVTLNMIANGQTIGGNSSSRKRRCLMF